MKLIKTANNTQIKFSRTEWESIGKKAGWIKEAQAEVHWIAVNFEDGNIINTKINGSKETILDYYLGEDRQGKIFNGIKSVSVDFVDEGE